MIKSKIIPSESSSVFINRQKIPQSIKRSIKNQASDIKQPNPKQSIFKKVMKNIVISDNFFICQICQCQYFTDQQVRMSKCQHAFCQSCLQHYTIYKVGIFQQVFCPKEDCFQTLDIKSKFFQRLPNDIKSKYKKVHLFYLTTKNPNLRLCPNEHCDEGTLQIIQGVNPQCQKCKKTFCSKCMFPVHEGKCDNNEIQFFQNNLHYRQCRKCCNHMTCKCGHQFCYVCGVDWDGNGHLCVQSGQQAIRPCDCLNCIDTQTFFGKICAFFVKLLLLLPLFIMLFCIRFFTYSVYMVLSISVGPFVGALAAELCKIFELAQSNCGDSVFIKLLLVIFLPITFLVAMCVSFVHLFQTFMIPYTLETFSSVVRDGINFFCW